MTRYARRGVKLWTRVFPDKPVCARPAETRMGSGKGAVDYCYWALVTLLPSSSKIYSALVTLLLGLSKIY